MLSWHVSSSGLEKEHVGEGPVLLSSLPFVCEGKKKKRLVQKGRIWQGWAGKLSFTALPDLM